MNEKDYLKKIIDCFVKIDLKEKTEFNYYLNCLKEHFSEDIVSKIIFLHYKYFPGLYIGTPTIFSLFKNNPKLVNIVKSTIFNNNIPSIWTLRRVFEVSRMHAYNIQKLFKDVPSK